MNQTTLHLSVAAVNALADHKAAVGRRMRGEHSERGEGLVGFMLVILLVIAIVAAVRSPLIDKFTGEAESLDLDISGDSADG